MSDPKDAYPYPAQGTFGVSKTQISLKFIVF